MEKQFSAENVRHACAYYAHKSLTQAFGSVVITCPKNGTTEKPSSGNPIEIKTLTITPALAYYDACPKITFDVIVDNTRTLESLGVQAFIVSAAHNLRGQLMSEICRISAQYSLPKASVRKPLSENPPISLPLRGRESGVEFSD